VQEGTKNLLFEGREVSRRLGEEQGPNTLKSPSKQSLEGKVRVKKEEDLLSPSQFWWETR